MGTSRYIFQIDPDTQTETTKNHLLFSCFGPGETRYTVFSAAQLSTGSCPAGCAAGRELTQHAGCSVGCEARPPAVPFSESSVGVFLRAFKLGLPRIDVT